MKLHVAEYVQGLLYVFASICTHTRTQLYIHILPTIINYPTRSVVSRISKIIAKRVNLQSKKQLSPIQWVATTEVINCFKNIDNKNKCTFIQFDIADFYPSISKDLFKMALEFTEVYTDISKDEINIILNCRKSVLIHDNEQWITNSDEKFDISVGSLDSAGSRFSRVFYIVQPYSL